MRVLRAMVMVALVGLPLGAQCRAPGHEDFETAVQSPGSPNCSMINPGVFPAGWANAATNLSAWRVRFEPTQSGNTGPSSDHTSGTGNYLYVESSCAPGSYVSVLNMPCWDATGLSQPVFGFHHHMWGATMGTLELQQADGAGGWTTLWSLSGDQGNAWQRVELPVVPLGGLFEGRFVYTRGSGFTGDCAIDDVFFGEPLWQQNTPAAELLLDGETGDAIAPHREIACAGLPSAFELRTALAGAAWDCGVSTAPLKAGSMTPGGQRLHLDFAAPLVFLNGGFAGVAALPFVAPVAGAAPALLAAQLAVADAAAADGFTLSAPTELEIRAAGMLAQPLTLPASSDANATAEIGCVPFFGRSYERLFVSTNGRIVFGGADTTFGPISAGDFLSDRPFFGYWMDLDPGLGGSITVSSAAPGVHVVDYVNVPYFGQPATANTFTLRIDSDQLSIEGLLGVQVNGGAPGTVPWGWLGASPGELVATDAGALPLTPGTYSAGAATDALYGYGDAGTLAAGTDTLLFVPVGATYQLVAF